MFFSFYEDNDSIIYCGTNNGLVKCNRKNDKQKIFKIENDIKQNNTIRSICRYDAEKLLIGTYNGLWFFDEKSEKFVEHKFNKLFPKSKYIKKITKVNNEFCILCNNGTFYHYKNNEFTEHKIKSSAVILSLFELNAQELLLGTLSDGLWFYNKKTRTSKKIKYKNVEINSVTDITENSKNEIFISTFGAGLLKISERNYNKISIIYEIKAADIYGVLLDENENLWFGTNIGLFKYNPKTRKTMSYHKYDGLQAEEFNFGAKLKCYDGEMFFGGVQGFNNFYPSNVKETKSLNKVIFTDLKILNKSIKANDKVNNKIVIDKNIEQAENIYLTYKDYFFSIHFASVDFKNSNKLKYRYMLEGFDKTWIVTDRKFRSATYRKMPAGNYVFKVQVSDNIGGWNVNEATINVNIEPPFWNKTWFYIAIILISISIIVIFIRLRNRQLRLEKNLLEKVVKEKTSELKASNEQLVDYKDHLEETVRIRTSELKSQNEEYLTLNEEFQQQNKELRLAKEKAEESDKLKSAFLANMSHEIRTPMNAIIGFSQFLNNDITKEKRANFVKMITSSGNTLLHLIDDIIDIAKIEAGQLTMINETFNIDEIIIEVFDSFRSTNDFEKLLEIDLRINIPPITNPKIWTDKHRFKQILNNLVSNAIKFTENGFIEIGYFINENTPKLVTFYVKDTGMGIPIEEQDTVFNRFSKGNKDMNIYRGTGLGLAISKNIVEKSGGDIWLVSEIGKGATFFFTMPISKEKL